MTQLGDIIRQWITHSFADIGYSRALEGLGVMRQECLELEEPGSYNAYLKDLKKSMKAEELGGDRSDMWRRMRSAKIGLIDSRAVSVSSVGEQEAEKVRSSGHDQLLILTGLVLPLASCHIIFPCKLGPSPSWILRDCFQPILKREHL